MTNTKEVPSILESYVGRRFPLLTICIVAALLFHYLGATEVSATLVGAVLLIVKDYVADVGKE